MTAHRIIVIGGQDVLAPLNNEESTHASSRIHHPQSPERRSGRFPATSTRAAEYLGVLGSEPASKGDTTRPKRTGAPGGRHPAPIITRTSLAQTGMHRI